MLLNMPTHPYLKGLAETRARADAEYAKATQAVTTCTEYLARLTAAFETQCRPTQRAIAQAQEQAKGALQARDACDKLIKSFDARIDPLAIEPVSAWQGRYGKRGALGQLLQAIVERAYPNEISTQEVSRELQLRLGLWFATPAERYKWQCGSVRGRLAYLCRLGLIEKQHDISKRGAEVGRWRACPPANLQEPLEALAASAGLKPTFAEDDIAAVHETSLGENDLPR